MPRKRRNDPPSLSDDPVCVTDPARERELVVEFLRKVAYIKRHYRIGQAVHGSVADHNAAIRALKRLAAGEPAGGEKHRRLPPMIELVVSLTARGIARERTGDKEAAVEGEDIRGASIHVAGFLEPVGHRPPATNLIYHVEGLMALIQDAAGRPVVPQRYRNSVYDPHFRPGVSEIVEIVFRELEPSVTSSQLVTIAERARKKWRGRRPTFEEYFPGYGLSIRPNGSLTSGCGVVIGRIEPNIPTYFH